MDLNTIKRVERPADLSAVGPWQPGHAWLAGGTWLFSEPQLGVDTLIDLDTLGWPSLTVTEVGLEIGATCKLAELESFPDRAPEAWIAAPLIRRCCRALLMSFKIYNEASVGGNIVMSLPAGAMISLTTALEATYVLWPREGDPREVAAIDFVTGEHKNVLAPGELLRRIFLPAPALRKRFALRQSTLSAIARSTALLIGTRCPERGEFLLTVTGSTDRPFRLGFAAMPSAGELRAAIDAAIPAECYYADPHSTPAYRRHLTYHHAEEIRAELSA